MIRRYSNNSRHSNEVYYFCCDTQSQGNWHTRSIIEYIFSSLALLFDVTKKRHGKYQNRASDYSYFKKPAGSSIFKWHEVGLICSLKNSFCLKKSNFNCLKKLIVNRKIRTKIYHLHKKV